MGYRGRMIGHQLRAAIRPGPRALLAMLLAAAAAPVAAQPVDSTEEITLTIELNDFGIAPETLILYEGQPYQLYFVNTSSRHHSFSAERFFREAAIAPEGAGAIEDGEIELDEGEVAIIHLIPPPADEYGARCAELFHGLVGQTADIEVRPMPPPSGSGAQ